MQPAWQVMLRWIAVFPGALICALAAYASWKLFYLITGPDGQSVGHIDFAASVIEGGAFVYAGMRIAPSHRRMVMYALAILGITGEVALWYSIRSYADRSTLVETIGAVGGIMLITGGVAIGKFDCDKPQLCVQQTLFRLRKLRKSVTVPTDDRYT